MDDADTDSSMILSEDAPPGAETQPPASWNAIGFFGDRFYFCGPRGIDPTGISVPGFGPVELLDRRGELFDRLNRIVDPYFAKSHFRWRVTSKELDDVNFQAIDAPGQFQARTAGQVLEIDG
ncbi:MAG: hypothetical protein LC634_04445, partial [Sphingomonadales bacterium]|nr:hypothetical protein [Sphingomonadales bacterium]